MATSEEQEPNPILATKPQPDQRSLFHISTTIYGVMAAAGAIIALYGHESLRQAILVGNEPLEWARLAAIGGLGAGTLLILSVFFEDWFPSYRMLKHTVTQLLGPSSIAMALYLAFISAVGEELLFRAAIQPYAGLVVTSILFGLLHMGPDGSLSAWSLWALIAGLLLGWMYQETQCIWPPMLAHFLVNAFSILSVRRRYRKQSSLATQAAAIEKIS